MYRVSILLFAMGASGLIALLLAAEHVLIS